MKEHDISIHWEEWDNSSQQISKFFQDRMALIQSEGSDDEIYHSDDDIVINMQPDPVIFEITLEFDEG